MIVKLFTRDGAFVHQQHLQAMDPAPELIGWGWRVFVRIAEVTITPDGAPAFHYAEGLLYPLADTRKGDGQ